MILDGLFYVISSVVAMDTSNISASNPKVKCCLFFLAFYLTFMNA